MTTIKTRAFAAAVLILTSACATPPTLPADPEAPACDASIEAEIRQAREVVAQREAAMALMRFASKAEMDRYVEQTSEIRAEAIRLAVTHACPDDLLE